MKKREREGNSLLDPAIALENEKKPFHSNLVITEEARILQKALEAKKHRHRAREEGKYESIFVRYVRAIFYKYIKAQYHKK